MAGFPSTMFGAGAVVENFGVGGCATSSANNKGAYTQLIASTARDYNALLLCPSSSSTSGRSFLLDLAVGSAGNEVVIVSNIFVYNGSEGFRSKFLFIPIHIKAGSRVSARGQCSSSSVTFDFDAYGIAGNLVASPALSGICTTYGAVTGSTAGTVVTSGTANVKGSYAELAASTTAPIHWLIIVFDHPSITTAEYGILDIAVGAGGSEQVVIPNLGYTIMTGGHPDPGVFCIPIFIPVGSRIAARIQQAGASRILQMELIGVN